MSIIKINYYNLNEISRRAANTETQIQYYIDDLTKKVTRNYQDITEGASNKTRNSEYYVNQKIIQLNNKRNYYSYFSRAIDTFSENAKNIDLEVSRKIKASKDEFIKQHDYIKVDWWSKLKEWFVELKNSCPLFEVIGNLINKTLEGIKNIKAVIKHWYVCCGGKELKEIFFALAGTISQIVIAVCAFVPPLGGIVGLCAGISAALTAINEITNVGTSIAAFISKRNGDPAKALIYENQDTFQDWLKQTNFKSRFLNKLSYETAFVFDVVQTGCDLVAIHNGIKNIKNIHKEIKKYSRQSRTRNYVQILGDYTFNQKNYKGEKMREIIQNRAEIRTLRERGLTKAMSIAQYNKSLENLHKSKIIANKTLKKYKKIYKNLGRASKMLDYTFGDRLSTKNISKDIKSEVKSYLTKHFKSAEVINNINNLYTKDFKGLKDDCEVLFGR